MAEANPDITVVVPTYRREKELVDTIHAMLTQSHKNLEVVVVDQSPGHLPETQKVLEGITDARFRYFRTTPPSLPAARNFALQVARAPIVLYLDDDIVPIKDLVKYHLQAFAEHPGISAVGGRVMQEGFPVQPKVLEFDKYAISHGVFTATEAGFTNAFPGGNCALKVADALKVGGFETRYYQNAFREESDMALKMTRAGMKIYYEPRAEILHLAAHYGGTRAKAYGHLYDTPRFYRNELFFTLRSVAPEDLKEALSRKYKEYCYPVRYFRAYRRRLLFILGYIAAKWRLRFGKPVISHEVES